MNKYQFPLLISLCILFFMGCSMTTKKKIPEKDTRQTDQAQGIVLLELYTSQGCSSCPPADELIGQYVQQNNPQIIGVTFHVDYWNRLGWMDSFSSARYSERQREYAQYFNTESVYTPQLIVNGHLEMVGSNVEEVKKAISNSLKENNTIQIAINEITELNGVITTAYTVSGKVKGKILQAALVQHQADTKIMSGENKGKKLSEYNVVRDFVSVLPEKSSGTLSLKLPEGRTSNDFSVIIFVQDGSNHKIEGVSQKSIK